MKAQTTTAALATAAVAVATAVAASAAATPPPAATAQAGAPRVDHMVVFRKGAFLRRRVVARRASADVDGRRCAVAAATPLAALLHARPGAIGFHDYGSCSRRPVDSTGVFVEAIRGQVNDGLDGWVYKVGRRLGTAGAADPAGPFGSGRLRRGDNVVWFYCVFDEGSCQRSLELRRRRDGRQVTVAVTGYDDAGDGRAIAGARVVAVRRPVRRRSGTRTSARTGADGRATLTLARGRYLLHAARKGLIRAFPRRVTVG
ncbi:MAG: hypothetical protein WD399_10820 [Thermoleophilaceae bacterium]